MESGSGGRPVRDIIDDVMVRLEMLEREIQAISREERYKGRILRMRDWINEIYDLMIELKKASESTRPSQR